MSINVGTSKDSENLNSSMDSFKTGSEIVRNTQKTGSILEGTQGFSTREKLQAEAKSVKEMREKKLKEKAEAYENMSEEDKQKLLAKKQAKEETKTAIANASAQVGTVAGKGFITVLLNCFSIFGFIQGLALTPSFMIGIAPFRGIKGEEVTREKYGMLSVVATSLACMLYYWLHEQRSGSRDLTAKNFLVYVLIFVVGVVCAWVQSNMIARMKQKGYLSAWSMFVYIMGAVECLFNLVVVVLLAELIFEHPIMVVVILGSLFTNFFQLHKKWAQYQGKIQAKKREAKHINPDDLTDEQVKEYMKRKKTEEARKAMAKEMNDKMDRGE